MISIAIPQTNFEELLHLRFLRADRILRHLVNFCLSNDNTGARIAVFLRLKGISCWFLTTAKEKLSFWCLFFALITFVSHEE